MAMQRNIPFGAILCAWAVAVAFLNPREAKAQADANGTDACKQGRAQYASGAVLKAAKTLGRCLERKPRDREAWIALANANLEAGRFQPAVEAFARAQSLKPGDEASPGDGASPGDEAFLASYLSALEGAGMSEERIPVLRALAGKRRGDRKAAENLLLAVEASGPDKHPDAYLAALQMLTEPPGAGKYLQEKLAAAYLKRGHTEKAEAEYRGLLVRDPESSDFWAGLGAALAVSDAQAAAECYRKAAFYSDQADHRVAYRKEQERLSSVQAPKPRNALAIADDSKDFAILAAVASPASGSGKAAPAPSKPQGMGPAPSATPAPATATSGPSAPGPALAAGSKPAGEAKPKPFDVKAYQDSVYKAELAKRLAALHAEKASPAAPAASAPLAASAASAPAPAAAAPVAAVPVAAPQSGAGSGSPPAKGDHVKEALLALESQYAKSGNDSLLEDLAALKRKNGDEAGAIAYLEKLAERHPGMEKVQEQLAVHYRAQGDTARATEKYSRVFIANTSNSEANHWLGMEAARSGEAARAVSFLEKAVTLSPRRGDAWKALARTYAAQGRKDAAWEAYRKAFALAPDAGIAREKLALARESRPGDVVQCYEDMLRLAPSDADAAMGLAKARFDQGDWPAAERNFRIACKDSKDANAWALFGRTLLELKKPDEASMALQKAVDLGGKDPALRLDLARIRLQKGDLDGAEALGKDLSRLFPSDPGPLYFLGGIALKRQQSAVAEEFFRKSHQLRPEDGKYAESLARLLKDKEAWKEAASVLALAESKLTASGRLLYGDCLVRAGDAAKAQAVYADLYAKNPSAPLLSRRMDLLTRLGKADQAVELAEAAEATNATKGKGYQDATEVRFSLAKAQLALADEHVLKGDVDMAVDLIKQVLKTDGRRPEYHYYLGLGYLGQNKPKKALDQFADALTYRVDYPDALYRKGLCLIRIGDAKDAENAFGELSQHAEPVWRARGLYGLAMAFEAQGKPEAVRHHLELSLSAHPLTDALASLSRVNLKEAKASEAQETARKALALDPAHEGATVAMAEALSGAKQQAEALELARRGLRAKPLSCGLLVQSAKLNFEAGKLDSTLAAGSSVIRICPEEPMGYYYAGVATHGSNRPKEARRYFKAFRKYGGDEKLVPED